ncbi:hypothetical protein [Bacillus anthracis]|uniref:hypothetical protein n=1 Tax=Bacillus anthracis TaxID=1392 RepID=UPI002DBBFD3E|nr:hypothetical protein [Bacillus anthracis]MEB9455937.1 hypothetical protein [Bacillus anthracis]
MNSVIDSLTKDELQLMDLVVKSMKKGLSYETFSAKEVKDFFMTTFRIRQNTAIGEYNITEQTVESLNKKLYASSDDTKELAQELEYHLEEFFKKHCKEYIDAIEGEPTRFTFK